MDFRMLCDGPIYRFIEGLQLAVERNENIDNNMINYVTKMMEDIKTAIIVEITLNQEEREQLVHQPIDIFIENYSIINLQ